MISGLSDNEARLRLEQDGYNELPKGRERGFADILFHILREPMIMLLIGAGVIYLLLGDLHEALTLVGSIVVIIGIDTYQERKTERAVQALRDLSSPRALVIRHGQRKRIAGREVVRGDVVVLSEGDRVPADAVLLSCTNLSTDESLLSGESVPVRKTVWDGSAKLGRPGGDNLPFVYSATLVVSGNGIAQVESTGTRTEMGKIGRALEQIEPEQTNLHRETGRLVRIIAGAGFALCAALAILYGVTRGSWLNGLLAATALAIAMVPEEFPLVLTIFLVLGAWRISKQQVLTRRTSAIEMLGSATVLCVDKTGTLTLNRMSVARLFAHGQICDLTSPPSNSVPEAFHEVVEFSILASRREPSDPMERAFKEFGDANLTGTEHLHSGWKLVREYPLRTSMLAMTRVWLPPGSSGFVIATKGAPEAVIGLCNLGDSERQHVINEATAMAREGLRVLGICKATFAGVEPPSDPRRFQFEFVGLVGLADPVRPTVAPAIQECYRAGIRILMITGDFAATAQSIARQAGLRNTDAVVLGHDLDHMDQVQLQAAVRTTSIFARVLPEQKLRLVEALKSTGEVVAMTGDGVNDAPALKSAHIGIAMGGRGTDVAREAADLVLLDDDFGSIVAAIRLGRRIYGNLRKALAFVLAVHIPIAGLSLIPVLAKWPLVLFPVHIVFLEFVTDPACTIAFEAEPETSDLMRHPPRDPAEKLFSGKMISFSLLLGTSVLVAALGVFFLGLHRGRDESNIRALTFATVVLGDLALVFLNRSWSHTVFGSLRKPNRALWWLTAATLGVLGLVLYAPPLRNVFRFSSPQLSDLAVCVVLVMACITWFEVLKIFSRRRQTSPPYIPLA